MEKGGSLRKVVGMDAPAAARLDLSRLIHFQPLDGRSADPRDTFRSQCIGGPAKVTTPALFARMKEWYVLVGHRIVGDLEGQFLLLARITT
jgi:hypothetical protein